MSVRVHVAAAYGVDPQELGAAFEKVGAVTAQQSGPWSWIQASVWGVDGKDIDAGLASLQAPSFRMTTVDGALWYLHLFHGGERRFTITHIFSFLRPLDPDDIGRRKFLTYLKDYEDYGLTLSKEMRRELKDLPFEEARRHFVRSQAQELCDALAAARIPFDHESLMAVLTGDSVTDAELGWDIGDMPRFLDVLGLGEVTPGWREEAETPQHEDVACEVEEESTPEFAVELIEQWQGAPPEPVSGGPLAHPITDLHQVCRVAWFCDEDVDAAIRVRLPEGAAAVMDFSSAQYARAWPTDSTLLVGYEASGGKWDTLLWTREAGPLLQGLPDGAVLELFTNSEYDIGRHLYTGPVNAGTWRIETASPPASREALEAALALSRYVDDGGPLKARDPEDAQAIADTAIRLYMLGENGLKKPQVKGASLQLRGKNINYERSFLALTAFRRWFADTWDTREVEADLEESERQWDEMIASVGKAFESAAAARIPQGALLHEGQAATFHAVDRAPDALSDSVRKTDKTFEGLGLQCLGNMTCSAAPGIELRGYAAEDGSMVGVFMLSPFGEYHDLVTYFEDGSSLTTTTTPNPRNDPARKIYGKHYRGTDLIKMHANHCEQSIQLQEKHGPPQHLPTTLKGLAETIDEFLVRQK